MKTKSKTKLNFFLSFLALLIFGNTLSLTVKAGGGCHVQNVTVINASTCNDNGTPNDPSDDYYTADVVVDYFSPSLTGSLRIFGTPLIAGQESVPVSALSSSPFTFDDVQFKANGVTGIFFGEFTDEVPACSQQANSTIVQSCSGCGSNTAPEFVSQSPACGSVISATVGVLVSFSLSTSDPDGNVHITLSSGALPSGAIMSPALPETDNPPSSFFSWTPGAGDIGQHIVTFTVTDNCGAEATCTYTIEVTANPCTGNNDPFTNSSPGCSSVIPATVGVAVSITLSASDPDAGDIVTLTSGVLPAGATMSTPLPATGNPVNSTFDWTPGAGDVGPHSVVFTFTDICGSDEFCSYTIDVADPCTGNQDPTTSSTPGCSSTIPATVGVPVSITVSASDPDAGDIVTLASGVLPVGATMSTPLPAAGNPVSSTFDWTPGAGDVGPHSVVFTFTDICGASEFCSYTIDVSASDPCAGPPSSPVYVSPTPPCGSTIAAAPGVPVTFTIAASDVDHPLNIITLSLSGSSFAVSTGATMLPALPSTGNPVSTVFSWTPTVADVGPQTAGFKIHDPCTNGNSYCSYTINVVNPCETNIAPAFIAPSPACASIIPFPVGIAHSFTVSASDVNASDMVTLAAAGVPATAALSTALPAAGNPVSTTFSWTPAAGDVGQHVVTFFVTDPCGLQVSCSYTLNVYACSSFTVNAGVDAQSFYGYPPQQTVTHSAAVTGGTPPFTYAWSMSRDLICNSVNTAGDESFSGGTCANITCPTSGTPASSAPYPLCTGSATITAGLLANAVVCVIVTDAGGCTATDCFTITAEDVRCFAGNSGPKKTKICHHTNSTTNPWIQICVDKNAVHAHLIANPGDYLGICNPKLDNAAYSQEMGMFVYPNPAQSQVTVEFVSPSDAVYQLSVFDITGRVVMTNNGSALEGVNEVILPINNIARGVYNLRLTVGEESSSVRLIVSE